MLEPQRPQRRKILILARSLLRVRHVALDDIPPQDRLGALESQLRAWQPFPACRIWVQMSGTHALAYACDSTQLPEDMPAAVQCLPEGALRPAGEEGLRLVQCLQGVEGQRWKSGQLAHSRWWAAVPTPDEWMAFVRASGQSQAESPVPPVESPPFQWPTVRLQALDQLRDSRTEVLHLAGLLLVFSLIGFAAYVGHEAQQSYDARERARQVLGTLEQEAAPARRAQDKAMRSRADLEAMTQTLQAVQPLELIDHLARVLQRGVVIKELELQGQELRLVLEPPAELSRSALIESLESAGWLAGVAEQKDTANRAWISLQARLKSPRPPAAVQGEGGVKRSSTDAVPSADKDKAAPPTIPPELLKGAR